MSEQKSPREKLLEAVERNDRKVAKWPESMLKAASIAPVFEARTTTAKERGGNR